MLLWAVTNVKSDGHSIKRHGEDAAKIHKCLDNNGPEQLWKITGYKRPNHFIETCKLDDGRWGLRIIQRTLKGWQEKTSFVVKRGTLTELREYITARAVRVR